MPATEAIFGLGWGSYQRQGGLSPDSNGLVKVEEGLLVVGCDDDQ
jgi:hypothetical protein